MSDGTGLRLPYFDRIIEELERSPHSELAQAFRRHVHWGYFSSPAAADDSLATYAAAAEEMTARVCRAGRVGDGKRILDVGCGFGGTIAYLNEHLSGCDLVGVNIDARQVALARDRVQARPHNTIRFIEGDASALPVGAAEFDVVLAVECIFHFPSRRQFFQEARRVLRPGGTLTVSDFVLNGATLDDLAAWHETNVSPQSAFYGTTSSALTSSAYARLARADGFDVTEDHDITAETMPTYASLRRLFGDVGFADGVKATAFLEDMARRTFFEYRILTFAPRAEGAQRG